jgi:hypothetical protein
MQACVSAEVNAVESHCRGTVDGMHNQNANQNTEPNRGSPGTHISDPPSTPRVDMTTGKSPSKLFCDRSRDLMMQ